MSIQLRIKYKTRSLLNFFRSLELPAWCDSRGVRVTLSVLVVLVGVAYVVETGSVATSGYKIHTLDKQVATLNNDIQQLSNQVAAGQSMTNIQRRLGEVSMVPAIGISYVKMPQAAAVAQR